MEAKRARARVASYICMHASIHELICDHLCVHQCLRPWMDLPFFIFVSYNYYIPFTEMLVTYACMSGPKVGIHTEILKPLNNSIS